MSAGNFFIKSEKLNANTLLTPIAMTQNLIDVRRQTEILRLQNINAGL
jgi:hypothetical protein